MMGNGDPKKHLTPRRKRLLRALLDTPFGLVRQTLGFTSDELAADLKHLEQIGLVVHGKTGYRPTFLIVAATEVAPIVARAKQSALLQVAHLDAYWPKFHNAMRELRLTSWTLPELAFFLVGNWLLDQSLLTALADDSDLMPPAPQRPSSDEPDAAYYLWLIEGDKADLGHYGQRAHALPWEGWYLITFGEYRVESRKSDKRAALEARAKNLVREGHPDTPTALAQRLSIPAFPQEVTAVWLERIYPIAEELVRLYRNERPVLEHLYHSLKASRYLPNGYGEFMCWYNHLVFAQTIDLLVEQGNIAVPPSRFVAALWQVEN